MAISSRITWASIAILEKIDRLATTFRMDRKVEFVTNFGIHVVGILSFSQTSNNCSSSCWEKVTIFYHNLVVLAGEKYLFKNAWASSSHVVMLLKGIDSSQSLALSCKKKRKQSYSNNIFSNFIYLDHSIYFDEGSKVLMKIFHRHPLIAFSLAIWINLNFNSKLVALIRACTIPGWVVGRNGW